MTVCAFSDGHGLLPTVPSCDLLLIAGDIIPLMCQRSEEDSRIWFIEVFKDWLNSIPTDKVLIIGGNHDMYISKFEEEFRNILKDTKCTYLKDELYEYNGIKIYGTPWCKVFGKWWFNLPDVELKVKFNNIPSNIDILLTHDAPYGTSDICLRSVWNYNEHLGNKPLAQAIIAKSPKFHIFGHLHTANHEWTPLSLTKVINVSLLDENYQEAYKPLLFEI